MLALLDQFIAYLEEQAKNHSIYVWGAQGQSKPTITESWIKSRESSAQNADRAITFWKKQVAMGYGDVLRAFDCSGLGMYWLYNLTGLYKGDMTANTMMGKCAKLTRDKLTRGDWVFRTDSAGKATHIGYVVDSSLNVIEAKGRDDGVVKRPLNASGASYWNAYGRPYIFFGDSAVSEYTQPAITTNDIPDDINPFIGIVKGTSVNIRSGRGESFERLCVAYNRPEEEALLLLSDLRDGWYQVALMPKSRGGCPVCGYVCAKYVQKKE